MRQNPTPNSTAASTPRVRTDHRPVAITAIAATDVATTGSSQLWNPYSNSGGVAAHSSAVRPVSRPSIHAVASPNGASSSAECWKNSASVCAPIAPSHISNPVSTGYSTVPPVSKPSGVMPPV